ncbi:hypothetical protein LINPERHAP1_LOCUS13302 [Linum perenne]
MMSMSTCLILLKSLLVT